MNELLPRSKLFVVYGPLEEAPATIPKLKLWSDPTPMFTITLEAFVPDFGYRSIRRYRRTLRSRVRHTTSSQHRFRLSISEQ
jgi:hypothetical protein